MNLECTPPINEFPMVLKIQVDSTVDENFSSLSGIYAMGKGKNILKQLYLNSTQVHGNKAKLENFKSQFAPQ